MEANHGTVLLTKKQKTELKPIATYAKRLPAGELGKLWERIKASISPDIAANTETYWQLLGAHLDAFFGDEPDPIAEMLEPEWQQDYIRAYGNYYLQLSLVVFHSESLIKSECKERGIEFPFKKRSELVKVLMMEDCLQELCKPLSEFYESLSVKDMRDVTQLLTGIAEDRIQIGMRQCRASQHPEKVMSALGKIRAKLQKLTRTEYEPENFSFWNNLCREVFWNNKEKIPAFDGYYASVRRLLNFWHSPSSSGYGLFKKHACNQGYYQESGLSKG